jgi:two-component system phosphate regulon sensor histidine kinase PhoR
MPENSFFRSLIFPWRKKSSRALTLPLAALPVTPHVSINAVMEALPQPTILLDERLFVRMHNRAAISLFPNLLVGQPLSFAVRIPEVLNALRSAVQGHCVQVDYSERVPLDTWRRAYVSPVKQPGDEQGISHVLLTVDDLTPIRRAERMRVDFVANASHELRTPLASLLGFVETLQGPAREDTVARTRFLEIMRVQAKRMARLVDDLLSLSSIEQKEHLQAHDCVNMCDVLAHVRDALMHVAHDKGVELAVTMPSTPVMVNGDRDDLIRLVENLTDNAIKYGQSGQKVDVELIPATADGAPEVAVNVRDFGPGISADHVPRLTERFYRVDTNESRGKGGTGLGLAIVKHILGRHGGRLVITSEVGKGSTFTAILKPVPSPK